MFRKLVYVTITLVIILGLTSSVFAVLSVGVKKGDWIESAVTYTGSPSQGHDINWARMEITSINSACIVNNKPL